MLSPEQIEANFQQMFANMDEKIKETGWFCMGVGSGVDVPGFAYTIGLAHQGLPDLIVIGLPYQMAHHVLGDAYTKLLKLKAAWPFDILDDVGEIFRDMEAVLGRVDDGEAYDSWMIQAAEYYKRHEMEPAGAVQLFWPDRNGTTILEDGFNPRFKQVQDRITPYGMKLAGGKQ